MAPQRYESFYWRFLVTNRTCATITFLDRIAKNRTVVPILNAPWTSTGEVPSDNTEINIVYTDGDPFLSYGNRFLFGFRREYPTPADAPDGNPWVCRFSGRLLLAEDRAASDQAMTPYTAFDPWQYALSRPVLADDGELPGTGGVKFTNRRASYMAVELLSRVTARGIADGMTAAEAACNIDWGQTAFYDGTLEATDVISGLSKFEQGMSVGEAWAQLVQSGTIDIALKPIYDPVNRPGYLSELSTYIRQGDDNYAAIFAWDKPSRSIVEVSRLHDGTALANVVQSYAGQGGNAVTVQEDAASIAKYGQWWIQQFYPGKEDGPIYVAGLAAAQLALRKSGKTTIAFSPAAERSPIPFRDYALGDRCPVYASADRFREALAPDLLAPVDSQRLQRFHSFPLQIGDDSIERVAGVLTADEST